MNRIFATALIYLLIAGCGEQVVVGLLAGPGPGFEGSDPDDNPSDIEDFVDSDRVNPTNSLCVWEDPYQTDVPMRGVFGFDGQDAWAVGGDGGSNSLLLHFDGERWHEVVPDPAVVDFGFSANGVWGIKRDGVQNVFIAHDFGVLKATISENVVEWNIELDTSEQLPEPLDALFDATWKGIFGNSSQEVYAVGGTINVPLAGGTIARYGGDKWMDMVGGERVDLGINSVQHIHGFGSGLPVFAVTASTMNYGQILKYTGEGWVVEHGVIPNVLLGEWTGLYGIWGPKADHIYAVGSRFRLGGILVNGVILQLTDGSKWSQLDLSDKLDSAELRGVWGRSDGTQVTVVGKKRANGFALRYDDDTWKQLHYGWEGQEPFAFPLNRIWEDDPGNIFIVGDKGIYYCLVTKEIRDYTDRDVSFGY